MHRFNVIPIFVALFIVAGGAAAQQGAPDAGIAEDGPRVVRVSFADRSVADDLANHIDVWKVYAGEGYLEALVTPEEALRLEAEGFELELDEAKTRKLARLGVPLKAQIAGIPGFPCYRTVEETYAAAEAIVAAHPDLATWIDIGDSWEKTRNPGAGWDLFVLKLTQSAVPGPKPVFFANFAIHARELTTAELGTRFAEMLADGYGVDPDVTWLLDHHEVHLLLQTNPDGRKRAESGALWRKNVDNDYCSNTPSRGADLNRNFDFAWGCCSGSSGNQCSSTFRGPAPGSEPEIQALQDYVRSIFPDQRGPGLSDPAPPDATGVAIDVHSFSEVVLWPWGFTFTAAPNAAAFTTLGRKLAFFNGYDPLTTSSFARVDGDSLDYFYGELGVAGLAYEVGTEFFEECSFFESNVLPGNLDSLLHAAKVARTPFLTPAGPEALNATATPASVVAGELVTLRATVDDTRFNNSNGAEPSQTIAAGEAFVDVPPWDEGAVPLAMVAADGTFDEGAETVEVTIDSSGLAAGRHMLFVRGIDTDGNAGVVAAAFLDVEPPAPCTIDAECDDGLFCNGVEFCDPFAGCQAAPAPCASGEICDEDGDVCVEGCLYETDFETGAAGWSRGADTCSTGAFVLGVPDATAWQVGGGNPGNALFTQPNSGGLGTDDVDGGTCEVLSPPVDAGAEGAVEISLDYFHGQRDAGDDPGDGFVIDVLSDGVVVETLVALGDVTHAAAWTPVSATVTDPGRIRVRVRATDGAGPGDIVEGGIDNVRICAAAPPPCSVEEDFESGDGGWTVSGLSTCSTGFFVIGTPTLESNGGVVTQVGGDHTTGAGNALFSAVNSSVGVDDVDGGVSIADSPVYQVGEASEVSVWYFHGQRDAGDDPGDFFRLEISTDGGRSFAPMVTEGDVSVDAAWTRATATVPAGSEVRLRIQASDGAGPGDLIEAGVDDLTICPLN